MAEHPRKTRTASGSRQRTRRQQALRAQSATHPHPETVTDPLFRDSTFFDPNDLVQVKYEMLRSVQQEERSVVEAAQASGLSRPAFYVTQELFQREGLPGLLPRKRGPKRPHKLSDEAMASWPRRYRRPEGCSRARNWRRFWPGALASRRIRGVSCAGCFRICGKRKKNFADRRSRKAGRPAVQRAVRIASLSGHRYCRQPDSGKHGRPDTRYWFCSAAERGHARMAQDSGICAVRFACSANSGFPRPCTA